MKGQAIETIVFLIIAISSVIVFLSLLGYFKGVSNWFYCKVYFRVKAFFIGEDIAIPETCREYITLPVEIEEIKDSDNKIFSRKLLAYIIACWKQAEIKGLYKTHPCYELHLKKYVDNVTEENVSRILNEEDHCISIENVDYGCGANNGIVWDIDGYVSQYLREENLSEAINNATIPNPIPVNESMFRLNQIKRKLELKQKLSSEIPEQICNYFSHNCYGKLFDPEEDKVTLNISLKNYTYSIDLVISYLERIGLIESPIVNQTIILIRYNGPKDAVDVIG